MITSLIEMPIVERPIVNKVQIENFTFSYKTCLSEANIKTSKPKCKDKEWSFASNHVSF